MYFLGARVKLCCYFFFFSSRRRHTRFDCDWSSDVCSSDLLYLENVDATFNRAVAAGAKVDMPLENQFWGDRYGKITDPFGHQWGLSQHVEEIGRASCRERV